MKEKTYIKLFIFMSILPTGIFLFFLSLCIFLSTYSAPSSGGVVFWETFGWGGCLCFLFLFFFPPHKVTEGLEDLYCKAKCMHSYSGAG